MHQAKLYTFLQRHRYAVVSSSASSGTPQSALVGIAVTPGIEIIFDTLKTSRKYPNLKAKPACSLVIGWEDEQTVQLEGIADEPSGDELRRCQEIYFATWPDGLDRISWPQIAYIAVRPKWIRYSDYSQNPPHLEEIEYR